MFGNKRNNDFACAYLLTGKVRFCLIVSVLPATPATRRMGTTFTTPLLVWTPAIPAFPPHPSQPMTHPMFHFSVIDEGFSSCFQSTALLRAQDYADMTLRVIVYSGISAITRLEKRFRTLLFVPGYSVFPELCSNLPRRLRASAPPCPCASVPLRSLRASAPLCVLCASAQPHRSLRRHLPPRPRQLFERIA